MGNTPSGKRKPSTSWLEAVDKSFVFVWCDASVGTQNYVDDANNTLKNIANVVNKNRQIVHTFNEIKACQEFIMQVNNVCLIISGAYGIDLVPQIHNLEQIHSIYIFCMHKAKHELWASHYRKVRGVFTNINDICISLKTYVISRAIIDFDRIEFDIITAENNLSLNYSILTKLFLLDMDSHDHGKQDMINYCRSEYKSDSQTQLIKDFERNYSQFNPIWWYTKNYFFQGIINRALRRRDLYALCSMYRFIKDLDIVLSQLHYEQKLTNQTLNLYFGQILSQNDFDCMINSNGKLMCINQFILANPQQAIATMFMKQENLQQGKVRIIFQIHIDQTASPIAPYANIGSISDFVHEEEHLISMSSIYRIGKIEQVLDMSSAWLIHLTLINKDDIQYLQLTQNLPIEKYEDLNLIDIGYTIKDRLYLFKSANTLFKQALNTHNHKNELRTIILHYNLAIIYDVFGEYDKSLEQYRNAITLARDYIPNCRQNDDLCLIPLYSNMGLTYQQDSKFNYAFDHAYRALQIISKIELNSTLKKELESSCYCNLGIIHDRQGKTSDARVFYEQGLKIRQEYLPAEHADIAALQRVIAVLSKRSIDSD
ncbi:hypothetical protein I4U23_009418 [Adineta vaga]|nr:hypothetical protein I4U23_009418 [Adineta vaga]